MKRLTNTVEIVRCVSIIVFIINLLSVGRFAEGERGHVSVVLITIDTLRVDHIGLYGYEKETTPNLDKFVRQNSCVVFEQAIAPVPLTLPAHAAILTGLYPFQLGVRDNDFSVVPLEAFTLAELFMKNGYTTAAFVSAFILHSKFGLNQGFAIYDDDFSLGRRSANVYAEREARLVTDSALRWLSGKSKESFFIWIHYYDPHDPYTPPEAYKKKLKDAYDGEIAYVDSQLARLFDYLNLNDLVKNNLIVIAGDHGESLGEHGEQFHGIFLYDATLKVPLIFCSDVFFRENRYIKNQVSLLDIFPTIAQLLSFDYPPVSGKSLLPLINGNASQEQHIFLETVLPFTTYGMSPLEGIRTSFFKYISAPQPEFYLLNTDKGETNNVYKKDDERVIKAHRKLAQIKMSSKIYQRKITNEDRESVERLRSLGYLSLPFELQTSLKALPDPKAYLDIIEKFSQAKDAFLGENYNKAIEILKNIIKEIPTCQLANLMIGEAFAKLGDYEKAISYLENSKDSFPDMALLDIASIYEQDKQMQKAIETLQEAIRGNPYFLEAYNSLAEIYIKQNNLDKAKEVLHKADRLGINDAKLRFLQGKVSFVQGNLAQSKFYLQNAIKLDSFLGEAYALLARLEVKDDNIGGAIEYYKRAIKLLPNEREWLISLAELYMKAGFYNKREAYNLLKRAIELEPQAPDVDRLKELLSKLE